MQVEIDNATTYKGLKTKRDMVKWFYRFIDDIVNGNTHATLVIQHDSDRDITDIHWGTTVIGDYEDED